MKKLKYFLLASCLLPLLIFLAIWFSDYHISSYSNKCFDDTQRIPANKVGLLLGTAKYLRNGWVNYYYTYRVEAAVELFKKGKISFILISGDNSQKSYNEPKTFKKDLIEKGVPEDRIVLDYAGFRTLDSIIRSKKVFDQNSITIISQQFHNERALFIAEKNNLKAVAFNAQDVNKRMRMKVMFREKFARVKALLDVYIINKQPKFLGKKIKI